MDDLLEYLDTQMDRMLQSTGRRIQLWWSVQVKDSTPLMKTVDYDEEEKWFRCPDDDDDHDDDDETPVYLHSGKLQILNRNQLAARMAEARQIILERNSGSIRSKSNVVIDSIGTVCFKLVNNTNLVK